MLKRHLLIITAVFTMLIPGHAEPPALSLVEIELATDHQRKYVYVYNTSTDHTIKATVEIHFSGKPGFLPPETTQKVYTLSPGEKKTIADYTEGPDTTAKVVGAEYVQSP